MGLRSAEKFALSVRQRTRGSGPYWAIIVGSYVASEMDARHDDPLRSRGGSTAAATIAVREATVAS